MFYFILVAHVIWSHISCIVISVLLVVLSTCLRELEFMSEWCELINLHNETSYELIALHFNPLAIYLTNFFIESITIS